MIQNERNLRKEHLNLVARQMATAARTAPKAKGLDVLEIIVVDGDEIECLSDKMKEIAAVKNLKFFIRDAENILHAEAIVIIGARNQNLGLNCGYCGFAGCAEKEKHTNVICAMNVADIGIAIGSATATAADWRVDSRVMFSVGLAAKELGWLKDCNVVYGIPISASSKNPFFDRG